MNKTELIAAAAEGAGLTKKDGQWYKVDGKQFTISLQCRLW